jgi:hypothetical protein
MRISCLAMLLCAGACSPLDQPLYQTPPKLSGWFANLNGGRTHAIAVNPDDRNTIVIATQYGGLWKSIDGGRNWTHLDGLSTVFAIDVAYSRTGTLVATLARDNAVVNGGGIYVSRDGGKTWVRPASGFIPTTDRTPSRPSAYGISVAPDNPLIWYVGTDYGVARSGDDGATWTHEEVSLPTVILDRELKKGAVSSVLAFSGGRVLALQGSGVYLRRGVNRGKIRGGNWKQVRAGDFTSYQASSHNQMDRWPDRDWAVIQQSYSELLLYDLVRNEWREVKLPKGSDARGPFVRVGASTKGATDLWVGQGVHAILSRVSDAPSIRALPEFNWLKISTGEGIHGDTGDVGVDGEGKPVLMGTDGGVFRPAISPLETDGLLVPPLSRWVNAPEPGGFNSLQISDVGGTNVARANGVQSHIYFATQDNSVWSSDDGGITWPKWDGGEGFHIEVQPIAVDGQKVTTAFGKSGDPKPESVFADPHLTNIRLVPDVDEADLPITKLSQAFYVGRDPFSANETYWIRANYPKPRALVKPKFLHGIYFSTDGEHFRRRFNLPYQVQGVFQTVLSGFPLHLLAVYLPVATGESNKDGSPQIGFVKLRSLQFPNTTAIGPANIITLPFGGSLGIRNTEYDKQAVLGVTPWGLIAPDIVNGDVKILRNGIVGWNVDEALTAAVTRNDTLMMWDRDSDHMQVTHIRYDPYRPDRVLIGTRDAGIICTADQGRTWRTVPGSERLHYITGFHFLPDGSAVVTSYGQGIWRLRSGPSGCGEADVSPEAIGAASGSLQPSASISNSPKHDQAPIAPDKAALRPAAGFPRMILTSGNQVMGAPTVSEGGTISVYGIDFPVGVGITFSLDGEPLGDVAKVEPDGSFSFEIAVDPLVFGGHRLQASFGKTVSVAEFFKVYDDSHLEPGASDQPREPKRETPPRIGEKR